MKHIKETVIRLLRRAERLTGTDNVYLAKNGTILFFTNAINVLNGFVLYILIGHFLPKEVYGEYKYYLSLFGLISIASFTGMDNAMFRSIARGLEGSLQVAFRRKLLGASVGSLFCLAGSAYYLAAGNRAIAAALVLIAVFSPIIYASTLYSSFFSAKKQFGTYSKISIALGLAYFCVMAVAVIFLHNSLQLLLVYLLISTVVVLGFIYANRKRKNDLRDPEMLKYGTHLSAVDILGVIALRIDSILIFHFLGPAPLAIYSLATVPVEQLKGFSKIIQGLAMPKFAVSELETLKRTIGRKLVLFTLFIAAGTGVYILLAPWFFALFFPRYLPSVPYSQVYAISLIFAVPASVLLSLFVAKGMKKEVTVWNTVNYTTQIILLVVLSWFYGIWGAVASRVIARALMLATSLTLLRKAGERA